jgi:hypothetical protein
VGYFRNIKKLSKVKNHPMVENSPNLVTLLASSDPKTDSRSKLCAPT